MKVVTTPASSTASAAARLPVLRVEDPVTMVIFGASGDLTARKLVPALYTMFTQGLLPPEFMILGSARRDYTDEHFRNLMVEAVRTFSRSEVDETLLRDFAGHIGYQRCDLGAPADFGSLKERLDTPDYPDNRLYYLSVMPSLFAPTVAALSGCGLISPAGSRPWTRVVVEKPFGRDEASAQALNQEMLGHLDESHIYRIDHYLGKETVQNILSFRLANAIFEPLFNNKFVDHVQITAAETVGVEGGRAGYYDSAGAVRDMVQNHLLQLLCLVAMEPPSGLDAAAIHNEKVQVLQSVKALSPEDVAECVVRAQYTAGETGGEPVIGYRDEDRVKNDSLTDTYLAMRFNVDNWRWAGVPFYLRTGKRLRRRSTEIAVQFKMPPLQLFQTVECEGDVCDLSRSEPNVLVFRIQPDEGISLHFAAKRPAMHLVVEGVKMDFSYAETWEQKLPDAYERLLLDVLRGDSTLFTRSDEVEAAWRVVDPILQAWQAEAGFPLATYPAGSWGPAEADALLLNGARWRNE